MQATTLGKAGVEFFEARKINPETAARFGVYTARHDRASKDVVPDEKGNIIVFPYWQNDVVVAEKFRGPDKKFWQRKNPKRIFYNRDVLKDPSLIDGTAAAIIVEGEPDLFAAIDCGFPMTVSVPDGAPPVPEGVDPTDLQPLDPKGEQQSKFDFMYEARDDLKRIKRFIIAVDSDKPGKRLAAELVRRLGAARCAFVTYPEGCKDINDVLMKHGVAEVARLLASPKQYPVKNLYRMSEAPDVGEIETFSTGWEMLDRDEQPGRMRVYPGALMVVTGVPSSGKSTWVTNLIVNLAKRYNWSTTLFSPEMPMVPFYRNKLRRIINAPNTYNADLFIDRYFTFIQADPDGDGEEMTIEWLIEKATEAVIRDGIRVFTVDPWNEIEHARQHGESMTDYIGRVLRIFRRFARQYGVLVIVVAHPTKDVAKDGKPRIPSLYDIEGSAHWFNKCDFGVIVERHEGSDTSLHIGKVRFEEAGERGTVKLTYDAPTSRYLTYRAPEGDGMMLFEQEGKPR